MILYRRSPEALSADIDDDVVALQATRGVAFGMEGVTASVWQLLENPISLDDMVIALQIEYEVEDAQCRREVGDLLAQMIEAGLVEKEPSA